MFIEILKDMQNSDCDFYALAAEIDSCKEVCL